MSIERHLAFIDKSIENAQTLDQLQVIGKAIAGDIANGEAWTKDQLELAITRTMYSMRKRELERERTQQRLDEMHEQSKPELAIDRCFRAGSSR